MPTKNSAEVQASWIPMIVIAMGQALMSFNVAALPVSMGGMVASFNTPPTTVGTAIVMYSLGVSGFIMLGGKLGQRIGSKMFFQISVALLLAAMVLMVISPNATVMLAAQALAGLGGAGLVPTLVALVAHHYQGRQQAAAVERGFHPARRPDVLEGRDGEGHGEDGAGWGRPEGDGEVQPAVTRNAKGRISGSAGREAVSVGRERDGPPQSLASPP